MNRIENVFASLKDKKALIAYITAGDPNAETTIELMHTLVDSGANIIELGMPFSDPTADGVIIQAAHERALKAGVNLVDVLKIVEQFRKKDKLTPIVLMGYLNPIEIMGYDNFIKRAKQAGIDGILIVDMPLEEGEEFFAKLKSAGLEPIFLIAPTTSPERLQNICKEARGFIYYVSLKGVTGSASLDLENVKKKVDTIKQFADVPVAVGFGIRDAESAKSVAKMADGIVIGSAIVSIIANEQNNCENMRDKVISFLSMIKTAIA